MQDLMEEKNGLVRDNLNNITKASDDILNNLSYQMKDKKLNAGGEIGGLLYSFKAMAVIDSESTLEMNSQDKVQYANLWFQNAEQIRTNMKERYGSQLKDVDEQLSVIKEEIKQINKKLKSVDDEAEKERLISEEAVGRATATRHNLT
jgi:iron only hydrogenase large subunit-like protein